LSIAQSAVVPYRRLNGVAEILLITSTGGKRWLIPKGLIEPDMTPWESAANEAYEEAGVLGHTDEMEIGVYEYFKWGATCRVRVYLMSVEKELDPFPESTFRTRRWVAAREAAAMTEDPGLRAILQIAAERLANAEPPAN
jgi:8-oxo-dGTP pyrophosphatase MutT (NUDIX family)